MWTTANRRGSAMLCMHAGQWFMAGRGGERVMEVDDRTLLTVLGHHVGPTRAQSILARVRRDLRGPAPPRQLITRLGEGLQAHIGPAASRAAIAELTRLVSGDQPVEAIELELRVESDIARARLAARDLCQALGSSPLAVQKLVTVVSELARNMVIYAGGGALTIRKTEDGRRSVFIAARDHGPGIANLDEILAGRYRSRTGLGLGILGTKRLADRFTIASSTAGTTIELEISY